MSAMKTNSARMLCVLATALFLTHCGDKSSGNDDATLDGTWSLTQLIISSTMFADTLTPGVDDITGTMSLNSDSTFSSDVDIEYTVTVGPVQVPVDTTFSTTGTWSATQDSITLTDPVAGSQTFAYDLSSGSMVTTMNFTISSVPIALYLSWKKQ